MTFGPHGKATSSQNFLGQFALPAKVEDKEEIPVDMLEDADVELDVLLTLTDVVCEECDPDQIILDPSIRTRSMSKKALILEAASEKHKKVHCEICDRSHMRQASVNVKKE